MTITFYPRALLRAVLVFGALTVLLSIGGDVRLGVAAVLATAAIDALSLLVPLVFGASYPSAKR